MEPVCGVVEAVAAAAVGGGDAPGGPELEDGLPLSGPAAKLLTPEGCSVADAPAPVDAA